MAVRRGMGVPPQASDPTAVGRALTGPAAAWSSSGTMRIPALGLKRKQWEPLAFASPSMALIAFVIVFPLAYSFYLSFQNFDLSVGPEYEFVGAKNYAEALFRDERFMGSVWNTALLIAPSLIRALAGARDRAPPEPRAPRAAYHHRAPGHPVDGLAGDGGDGVADDVRGQVRGHQQSRAAARNPRRLLRLVLVAPGVDHRRRAGRGLAQHVVHDAGPAGRAAVDPDRALRGGQGGRRQRLATLLVDHAAVAEVHHGGRRDDQADRSHEAVR